MKDFSIIDYVFSPGASSVGYVDFIGATDFDITRVVAIINQTKGVVIYATGSTDTRYTSISDKRVFLFFDTSTHSASDKLQIVYNSKKALITSDSEGNELIRLMGRLVKIMENQQATDAGQRQKMTIDSITSALTLSNVTTVGTVSTITGGTITTLSNAASIAGMSQEQYINIARNTYANSIRSKLNFS